MLLKPNKGELEKDFIARFMSDEAMIADMPDKSQRSAIAYSQWESHDKTDSNKENFCHIEHNMSALIKKQKLNDKEYWVAPIKMMPEEFVMNGKLYMAQATRNSVEEWNGRALVVYHPEEPISANTPEFLATHKIGHVFNSRIENGFLMGDGFIDIVEANKIEVGRKLISYLEQNKNIDVSTSMRNKTYKTKGVKFNRSYDEVVFSFNPDHLALLPDQKGAASWADGAGFARNNDNNTPKTENNKMDRKELLAMLISGGIVSANEQKKFEEMEDSAFLAEVKTAFESNKKLMGEIGIEKTALVAANEKIAELEKAGNKPVGLNAADRAILEWGKSEIQKQKDAVVESISSNANCGFTKEELNAKSVDELRKIATLVSSNQEKPQINYIGGLPPTSDVGNNADKEYLATLNNPKK